MANRCPICSFDNPPAAARCEKCKAWLKQTADLGPSGSSAAGSPQPQAASAEFDADFVNHLVALVRDGRKIEAIRIFRETTGSGLAEAKEAVEAMEAGRQTPYSEGRRPPPATIQENEILELVRGGNLIGAIKLYRERTGEGLKDSKDAVETLARAHGIPVAQNVGCKGAALMLLVGFVVTLGLGVGLAIFGKVLVAKLMGL